MGKFTAYKVELGSLKDGHYEQDFEITEEFFKNMENYEIQKADIHVHMDMEKRHDAYDCKFHCKGTLQVPCDRCLDPLEHEVDAEYKVIVKYGDEYNDSGDNVLEIPWSSRYLNVAYMLYDTIVLTIPIRHVHPLGKCNRQMLEALKKHRTAGEEEVDGVEIEEIEGESEE